LVNGNGSLKIAEKKRRPQKGKRRVGPKWSGLKRKKGPIKKSLPLGAGEGPPPNGVEANREKSGKFPKVRDCAKKKRTGITSKGVETTGRPKLKKGHGKGGGDEDSDHRAAGKKRGRMERDRSWGKTNKGLQRVSKVEEGGKGEPRREEKGR